MGIRESDGYNAAMPLARRDFARIGILGGGQLGQMMMLAGIPLGFQFGILTPSRDDPAARLALHHEPGALDDDAAIHRLVSWADVTTYEIEHVDTDALQAAENAGGRILPRPVLLGTINDKLEQKRALQAAGIPVPGIAVQPQGYPIVQKLRRGGYDGRGVKILRDDRDRPLDGASYYEELVEFERELAVIVARSTSGETTTYPVVEMEFDADANICARVIAPARIEPSQETRAREVALAAVEALDGVGVLAVELFLARDGQILVNEIAPRPHNSGHLTIEACATSQFEQHLRAITGLPLGETALRSAAVMVNVLGDSGACGRPRLPAIDRLLERPGVHLHWYGKTEVRPYRKMGHVTVVADDLDDALTTAQEILPETRVTGGADDR